VAAEAAERREAREARDVATEVASVANEMVICCELDVFAKSDPPPGTRAAMAARLCARDSATVGPEEVEGTEDAISSKVRRTVERYG
jgi:hypothetical protein